MPPKKTNPNAKCPCGSGKKHKKCCMVAGKLSSSMVAALSSTTATTTTTVLDEVMEALSSAADTVINTGTASATANPTISASATEIAREKAATRQQRILENADKRMNYVNGEQVQDEVDEKASMSNATRIRAARQRRYGKKTASMVTSISNGTSTIENASSDATDTTQYAAENEGSNDEDNDVKEIEQNTGSSKDDVTAPVAADKKKQYLGVAKVRRQMLAKKRLENTEGKNSPAATAAAATTTIANDTAVATAGATAATTSIIASALAIGVAVADAVVPPKKAKPNKTSVVSSSSTINSDELVDELSLTNTFNNTITAYTAATLARDIGPCLHGSTSVNFPDCTAYTDVIYGYLLSHTLVAQTIGMREQFDEDHKEYFEDIHFSRYIFALCTSRYLKVKRATTEGLDAKSEMRLLLSLALRIKYNIAPLASALNSPLYSEGKGEYDPDKLKRYQRAIILCDDDRGVINCLFRETKPYCDCMDDKKTEAKSMDKIEYCNGCHNSFSRESIKKCRGCKVAFFCSKDCYKKNWPAHKERCAESKQNAAETRDIKQKIDQLYQSEHTE